MFTWSFSWKYFSGYHFTWCTVEVFSGHSHAQGHRWEIDRWSFLRKSRDKIDKAGDRTLLQALLSNIGKCLSSRRQLPLCSQIWKTRWKKNILILVFFWKAGFKALSDLLTTTGSRWSSCRNVNNYDWWVKMFRAATHWVTLIVPFCHPGWEEMENLSGN